MMGSIARSNASVKFRYSQERECLNHARKTMRMEQDEFASKVLEAIQKDGKA